MRRQLAPFPTVFALTAIILVPGAGTRADPREEGGPFEIEKCQTISNPGSYKLVNNITFKGPTGGACLEITADFATIDLAGFTISQPNISLAGTGIKAAPASNSGGLQGIAVRNGSVADFLVAVDLSSADGSIVEGLRVFDGVGNGIVANGIVKGNTVLRVGFGPPSPGMGISGTGIITGNYVTGSREIGIDAGQGSTVIGNTAINNFLSGIVVECPSNVTDNTALKSIRGPNLQLIGDGCNSKNNVAP